MESFAHHTYILFFVAVCLFVFAKWMVLFISLIDVIIFIFKRQLNFILIHYTSNKTVGLILFWGIGILLVVFIISYGVSIAVLKRKKRSEAISIASLVFFNLCYFSFTFIITGKIIGLRAVFSNKYGCNVSIIDDFT